MNNNIKTKNEKMNENSNNKSESSSNYNNEYEQLSVSSNDSAELLEYKENLNDSGERENIRQTALKNFKEKQGEKRKKAILVNT